MITAKARNLIEKHKENEDKLLIITATNSYITKPIANLLGINNHIGTDLEEINGEFTGKAKGIPSFREGKVERLNLWLKQQKLTLHDFEKTFFYSDSQNDIPLLKIVSNPVATNPDEVLQKEAMKNNDLLEVADALTDILYVTYGAGHAFGIDLDKCFDEVQNSNMSKLGENGEPIYNESGKVMKGPNYFKPDLSKFVS